MSFRARMREREIVELHCGKGLSFREIGKRLKISHVAAWKRYQWAQEGIRLRVAYFQKCWEEIQLKLAEMDRIERGCEGLPMAEIQKRVAHLLPKRHTATSRKRRD